MAKSDKDKTKKETKTEKKEKFPYEVAEGKSISMGKKGVLGPGDEIKIEWFPGYSEDKKEEFQKKLDEFVESKHVKKN